MIPVVVIVNRCTLVAMAELDAAVAAIQKQIDGEFSAAWGLEATLAACGPEDTLPPGAWPVYLEDVCTVPGALGYHEDDSIPSGRVGVKTCQDDGIPFESCLSHEILEILVDSTARLASETSRGWFAYECCDPVEGKPYIIDNIAVENFCLPSWWIEKSTGPWDHLGVLLAPLTLAPCGYAMVKTYAGWSQINAEHVRPSKKIIAPYSRRAKHL